MLPRLIIASLLALAFAGATAFGTSITTTGAGKAGSVTPVSITFNNSNTDTTDQSTYSFAGLSVGSAATGRCLVATWGARSNSARTVSSANIGGVAATCVTANEASGGAEMSSLCYASVPTGTTATFDITYSGAMLRAVLGNYAVYNAGSCTPSATNTATANAANPTMTLTTPANGGTIAGFMGNSAGTATVTWTAPTIEDYDTQPETPSNGMSGAHDTTVAAQTGRTITLTVTSPTAGQALAGASWGP